MVNINNPFDAITNHYPAIDRLFCQFANVSSLTHSTSTRFVTAQNTDLWMSNRISKAISDRIVSRPNGNSERGLGRGQKYVLGQQYGFVLLSYWFSVLTFTVQIPLPYLAG
jgi:hypothetical protein